MRWFSKPVIIGGLALSVVVASLVLLNGSDRGLGDLYSAVKPNAVVLRHIFFQSNDGALTDSDVTVLAEPDFGKGALADLSHPHEVLRSCPDSLPTCVPAWTAISAMPAGIVEQPPLSLPHDLSQRAHELLSSTATVCTAHTEGRVGAADYREVVLLCVNRDEQLLYYRSTRL